MIVNEFKIIVNEDIDINHCPVGNYVSGYFLTINDLVKLVRDFQADHHDGFVSNDKSYIERWLNKHERIENK